MNARRVNTAADVIMAALTQDRTAAGIALALDSAQLLQSPETAAELVRLRVRVAELEAGLPVMQEALFKALDRVTELEAERHVTNEALDDAVRELRARDDATAPYTATPEAHRQMRAALTKHYTHARGGNCENCGSAPEQWCPDCAACEQGCFGGFDGNSCSHSNARWRRSAQASADKLTRLLAPTQALREGEHFAATHHDYRVGRDLPEMGGAR